MSDATRALSQLAYLEIFKGQRKTAIDIKGWVANQKYFVSPGMTSTCFTLTTQDSEGLRAALANDCNRMAMAAIESVSGIGLEMHFPKSAAWALIRSYYASFFAAHALLRVFGCSYSQLESEHVRKIFEMAEMLNVQGICSNIEKGFYSIKIGKQFTTLEFEKKKDSHKDLWQGFLILINRLYEDIDTTSAISSHKLKAMDLLVEARNSVTKQGARSMGNWLSELRNQVNYQHLHSAWYPYELGAIDRRIVESVNTQWKKPSDTFSASTRHGELEVFFESTSLLLSLLRETLVICIDRSGENNSIFQNGVMRMLRTVRAN